jgi:glutaredoxin
LDIVHSTKSTKEETAMLLADIAPDISSQLDADNHVILFSRPGCGPCIFTHKGLESNGVPVKKVIVTDAAHPVIVAVKAHLDVHPDLPIELPAVFTWGEFKWNGFNEDAINETIASVKTAA